MIVACSATCPRDRTTLIAIVDDPPVIPCSHLQEVIRCPAGDHWFACTRTWIELQKSVLEVLVDLHDCGLVTATVAVIWRCTTHISIGHFFQAGLWCLTRENRHHVSILTPIVALHDQLMRSRNKSQAIVVVKGLADILAECVSCSSWAYAPSTSVVWVTPQQITHWTLVWNFLNTVESSDVIQGVDAGRKTSVQAENLVVNQGGQWQVIEQVGKVLPDVGIAVFAQAFVVESVNLCDLSGFVVSS